MDIEQIYEAIRDLSPSDRLRLVERVVHDVAERELSGARAGSIMGMMADEPELMDQVCGLAMAAREKSRMRPVDG
jgi:hypothetical protein